MQSQITGDNMQALILKLSSGEKAYAEAGSMMYMNSGIKIDSEMKGGILKSLGRSIFGGESLFMSTFEAIGENAEVGFASPFPGTIREIKLNDSEIICQRDGYMASIGDVDLSIKLTKKLSFGFFGGEGFILQSVKGTGTTWIHAGGNFVELELEAGQTLKVDTGCLVALEPTVDYDIKFTGNIKTSIFGGEGLFLAHLTGPGKIYLQTLPFSRMANKIVSSTGGSQGQSRGAGGIGGGILKSVVSGN